MTQDSHIATPQERATPTVSPRKSVSIKSAALKREEERFAGEDRRRLIAQAAYFRAEQRGFAPGRELEDWLAAEIEIDALLGDDDGQA